MEMWIRPDLGHRKRKHVSKVVIVCGVLVSVAAIWTSASGKSSKPAALSREDGLEMELVSEKLAHAQLNLAVAQAQANDAQAANNALVTKLAKKYGLVVGRDVVDIHNGYTITWGGSKQPVTPSPDGGVR